MTINEDHSPDLIGRQVDRSTNQFLLLTIYLSTCRPSAIVNNKDPVRVRLGLGSGLVWGLGWVRVRVNC